MKRILLLTIALALGFSVVYPSSAYAQVAEENESITLSPVSSKYKIDAGQTISDKLTVVNDGKTDYDFIVYSRPYSIPKTGNNSYDYTNPNFTETTKNADAYGWIRFSQTKVRLAAGETAVINYSISVPKQATPGGHYGVIFAETQPVTGQENGNSVIRKKRVGSLVYVTVNGEFTTGGKVVSTDIPFWQLQPPLLVETEVKNTGNSDFTDDTIYTVKDVFGNVKYKEIKQYTVLPQTTRKMAFEWKQASWFGLYKIELQQTVLGKKSSESGYVLILPRYIPALLIVFVLIGGGYAWLKRKMFALRKNNALLFGACLSFVFLVLGGTNVHAQSGSEVNAVICGAGAYVNIASPVSDSVVTDSTIEMKGSVQQASQIEVRIDGVYNGIIPIDTGQQTYEAPVELSQGTHTISLRAVDSCGNANSDASVVVTYTPAPAVASDGNTIPTVADGVVIGESQEMVEQSSTQSLLPPEAVEAWESLLQWLNISTTDSSSGTVPQLSLLRAVTIAIGTYLATVGLAAAVISSIASTTPLRRFAVSQRYKVVSRFSRILGILLLLGGFFL